MVTNSVQKQEQVTTTGNNKQKKNHKDGEKKTFSKMSIGEKVRHLREVITVEPVMGSFVMGTAITVPALMNLEFEKACRVNKGFNDTVCDAILSGNHQNYTRQNNEVQMLIADMHSFLQPVQSIVPLIFILVLGSYSDRHKIRIPFLMLPIIAELISVACLVLCVFFMKTWPLEAQGVAQIVIPSFFGKAMLVMAVYAYVADVSSLEMRTFRIAVVNMIANFCTPTAQLFSGILFAKLGYYGILMISASLYMIGLLHGIFWLKEPKQHTENVKKKAMIIDIFNYQNIVDPFKLLFTSSPGNNRLVIILVMFLIFIITGICQAENSVLFLFLQSTYNWTPIQFSYYQTIQTMLHLLGTATFIPLLTRALHLSDYSILAFTFFLKVIANTVMITYKSLYGVYIGTIIGMIAGVGAVAMRSMTTKMVSEDNIGKAQTLSAIVEALGPMLFVPVYNKAIYVETMNEFPQAFFLPGVPILSVGILILLWINYKRRKQQMKVAPADTTKTSDKTEVC